MAGRPVSIDSAVTGSSAVADDDVRWDRDATTENASTSWSRAAASRPRARDRAWQALGAAFRVAIADPALARESIEDPRATAIAAAARHLLQVIGAWNAVADAAQPIQDMAVTDGRVTDVVRPVFLTFAGEVAPGEPFAHMVENAHLEALSARARAQNVLLLPTAVADLESGPAPWQPSATARPGRRGWWSRPDGKPGARPCRHRDGRLELGQSAIVTTVAHERDHGGRAQEHFLAAGPFAILPLTDAASSIVWTETHAEADRIVALPDTDFHAELERRSASSWEISRWPGRDGPIRSASRSRGLSWASASRSSATPRT